VGVPGAALAASLFDQGAAFVPGFEVDSEPYDTQVGDTAAPASNAADGATNGDSAAAGAPRTGFCDNETSNKVVIAADARAVVCYLDVSNFPHAELYEPTRVDIAGKAYVRVGGYSTCEGSSHAIITRVYTVCAERNVPRTNLWHIMSPCRKVVKRGLGLASLGHDTRCTDRRALYRRTFASLVLHDPAADNGTTKTKKIHTAGVLIDCG
jgi:hypothetical protein